MEGKFDSVANEGVCACIKVQGDTKCILVTERSSRLLPGRLNTDLKQQA